MPVMEWLFRLLYPPKCVLCQKLLQDDETDLCGACRTSLTAGKRPRRSAEHLSAVIAACCYEDQVRASLLRYKFHGRSYYAEAYARLLAPCIAAEAPAFDLLSWIPVSAKRRRQRGYDQAQLLAQAVGKELGCAAVPTLRKRSDNPPQSGIQDRAARRANVLGVYQTLDGQELRGKRVLLVDDIFTTGATSSEAARTLLTVGAEEVAVAVLAAVRE